MKDWFGMSIWKVIEISKLHITFCASYLIISDVQC